MTPGEFAEAHGLSLEEAEFVLSRRRNLAQVESTGGGVGLARQVLVAAQKRVGVHPVSLEGESIEVTHDPDAAVGKAEFYRKQGGVSFDPPLRTSDRWEDPP